MDVIEVETGARWRWHDLKAAFTTHLATSGVAPVLVQAMSRHSHMATTMRYIAFADEERVKAAEQAAARPGLKLVRS